MAVEPLTHSMLLKPGVTIWHEGSSYTIITLASLSSLSARNNLTGEIEVLAIKNIQLKDSSVDVPPLPIHSLSIKDEETIEKRFSIIQPLLNDPQRTRKDVEAHAKKMNCHPATLYRWLTLYERSNQKTCLCRNGRSDRSKGRLATEIEQIIQVAIEENFLTKQRVPMQTICDIVKRQCSCAGLKIPHDDTIRNRINALDLRTKLARRNGRKASQYLMPVPGQFPEPDKPLAVVQIDHTPMDIIVVDEMDRQPIGRPYLTLAIDVYSRMVVGLYISLDPPGAISVGMCLVSSILSKERLLAKHEIAGSWPVWGVMQSLHLDNAKEFRGKMLQKACDLYNIHIDWRPVMRPHFGGHVERYLGTLMQKLHTLPGTTFSNTIDKGEYNSLKKASLTLPELEKWVLTYIVGVYHQKIHSSLGTTPLARYEEGIFGSKLRKGRGFLNKVKDEERLYLDFLPFVERTVQSNGVTIDNITYYADVLRPWIHSVSSRGSKQKRKFIFKRDPRDISVIWFFDPELNQYFAIPYQNTAYPAISVWELRKAQARLKEQGQKQVNEEMIFTAIAEMEVISSSSQKKTLKERRKLASRKYAIKSPQPQLLLEETDPIPSVELLESFDDIEEWEPDV